MDIGYSIYEELQTLNNKIETIKTSIGELAVWNYWTQLYLSNLNYTPDIVGYLENISLYQIYLESDLYYIVDALYIDNNLTKDKSIANILKNIFFKGGFYDINNMTSSVFWNFSDVESPTLSLYMSIIDTLDFRLNNYLHSVFHYSTETMEKSVFYEYLGDYDFVSVLDKFDNFNISVNWSKSDLLFQF